MKVRKKSICMTHCPESLLMSDATCFLIQKWELDGRDAVGFLILIVFFLAMERSVNAFFQVGRIFIFLSAILFSKITIKLRIIDGTLFNHGNIFCICPFHMVKFLLAWVKFFTCLTFCEP